MRLRRAINSVVITFLVLTPCFGFAAGEVSPPSKPAGETAPHHDGPPQFVWKTTPATIVALPPIPSFGLLGRLTVADARSPASFVSRPPFVPPRA